MIIQNEAVNALIAEVPDGHRHVRITMRFADGKEMTFQEATIANLVRAYIRIKTHPHITRIELKGQFIVGGKDGFAAWQLLEREVD